VPQQLGLDQRSVSLGGGDVAALIVFLLLVGLGVYAVWWFFLRRFPYTMGIEVTFALSEEAPTAADVDRDGDSFEGDQRSPAQPPAASSNPPPGRTMTCTLPLLHGSVTWFHQRQLDDIVFEAVPRFRLPSGQLSWPGSELCGHVLALGQPSPELQRIYELALFVLNRLQVGGMLCFGQAPADLGLCVSESASACALIEPEEMLATGSVKQLLDRCVHQLVVGGGNLRSLLNDVFCCCARVMPDSFLCVSKFDLSACVRVSLIHHTQTFRCWRPWIRTPNATTYAERSAA